MSKFFLDTFRKVLKNQNMYVEETPSLLYTFLSSILSLLQGYNHQKYWKRREALMRNNISVFTRVLYLLYVKRVDSKHLSSFGTGWKEGAHFSTPPYCLMDLMV